MANLGGEGQSQQLFAQCCDKRTTIKKRVVWLPFHGLSLVDLESLIFQIFSSSLSPGSLNVGSTLQFATGGFGLGFFVVLASLTDVGFKEVVGDRRSRNVTFWCGRMRPNTSQCVEM
jgi:hypothetical protein